MKKIILKGLFFSLWPLCASEFESPEVLAVLRYKFLADIDVRHEKFKKELKSFALLGSEEKKREEIWIKQVRRRNKNIRDYLHSLPTNEILAQFQTAFEKDSLTGIRYLIFNFTEVDTIVFDSLQLADSAAYFMEMTQMVSQ